MDWVRWHSPIIRCLVQKQKRNVNKKLLLKLSSQLNNISKYTLTCLYVSVGIIQSLTCNSVSFLINGMYKCGAAKINWANEKIRSVYAISEMVTRHDIVNDMLVLVRVVFCDMRPHQRRYGVKLFDVQSVELPKHFRIIGV